MQWRSQDQGGLGEGGLTRFYLTRVRVALLLTRRADTAGNCKGRKQMKTATRELTSISRMTPEEGSGSPDDGKGKQISHGPRTKRQGEGRGLRAA